MLEVSEIGHLSLIPWTRAIAVQRAVSAIHEHLAHSGRKPIVLNKRDLVVALSGAFARIMCAVLVSEVRLPRHDVLP